MKFITLLVLQFCFLTSLFAGDRGCSIGIVDISTGEPTKASKRLFELLQIDAKKIYTAGKEYQFGWRTDESMVHTVNPASVKGLFKPMILCSDQKALGRILEQKKLWEGLIVFEYDHKTHHARFKLFDRDGTELALIKLPVERDGAMKHSLFKHVRSATLTALGHYVRFSP